MDFDEVRLTGANFEVCAELQGNERRHAALEECATMRLTIDGVNLSDLSPFPILDTVVFLRFATGTADEDVYEGPCSLDTIEDYPGRSHCGERCFAHYHEFIDSSQELQEEMGVAISMHATVQQYAAFVINMQYPGNGQNYWNTDE